VVRRVGGVGDRKNEGVMMIIIKHMENIACVFIRYGFVRALS